MIGASKAHKEYEAIDRDGSQRAVRELVRELEKDLRDMRRGLRKLKRENERASRG